MTDNTQPQPGAVYAELPAPNLPRGGFPDLFTEGQMRDFADRTHALRMEQAAPKAAPGEPFDECFPGEPRVAVPQGLISAACFAIRNKRDGGKVLEQLRRYSVGDLSRPLAPQQKAHHLTQALTDQENQPNQYGVEFGMSGQQMHFKIGNQLFRLAYEPDDQQEFEFMKRMLIHAFSTFTPDVKAAPGEQNAVSAEWLEQAYREGWAACRDAETIGEEAEDWAFGNSTANSRMIDAQQAAPKQEVQEPHGWLYEWTHSSATGKPDSTYTAFTTDEAHARKHDNCRAIYTAPQPAPAPLSRDQIREVFMSHGFTIKEGQTDLKQYVYDAAYALLGTKPAPLSDDAERLNWLLWKLPGDALRYAVGELADTSSGAEFRAAIDAAIAAQGGK